MKKHCQRQRGRGGRFQRSRGITYGESSRSENAIQDNGKTEWKEPTRKRGNYTKGIHTGYPRNNNGGKREEESWFKVTCYKCGKEAHRALECTKFRKKIGGNSRNTLACEEVVETPNEPENGVNLMLRRIFWNK